MTHRFALVFGFGFLLFALAAQRSLKPRVFGGYRYARPDGGPNSNGWNAALTGNFKQGSESPLILMAHMVLVPACPPAFGPKLTAILPQAWCCSFDGAGERHQT
jgi:hypothetical protein